jgi:DNA-nicking Smr family endonuclease
MSRRRRGLTPDEAALWERVAGSARPLHPDRPRPPAPAAAPALAAGGKPSAAPEPEPIPPFRIGEAAPGPGGRHALQPTLSERLAGEPMRMDRKAYGRLTRGKLKPEAKLDLHGMTLSEAYPALVRFLLSAQSRGLRLVLVVTGKGRDRDEGGPIPARRGLIRHQLPHWLAQPPLAPIVLQVAEAHARHGGGGAFYVYLRRPTGAIAPPR